MKCYMCALEGKDSDAVAICIVCGMGLCMDHVIRNDIDVWVGGFPLPSKKLENRMPKMLCEWCYEAYKSD